MPQSLLAQLRDLQNNGVASSINSRYAEFKSFASRSEAEWFSELCFCLTTANSSAEMGLKVQDAIGFEGFYGLPRKKLSARLKSLGYRFYNKRAEYIVEARKHLGIKSKLREFETDREKRSFLVGAIKGYSFKEASHFLRNTGHDNCAILDRHILRIMAEHEMIDSMPDHISPKKYLEYESVLDSFAEKAGMNHSLLDLYLWYMKTGKVLK